MSGWRVVLIIASVAVLGCLMGLRTELDAQWQRNLTAGVAFVFLGLAIQIVRRRGENAASRP